MHRPRPAPDSQPRPLLDIGRCPPRAREARGVRSEREVALPGSARPREQHREIAGEEARGMNRRAIAGGRGGRERAARGFRTESRSGEAICRHRGRGQVARPDAGSAAPSTLPPRRRIALRVFDSDPTGAAIARRGRPLRCEGRGGEPPVSARLAMTQAGGDEPVEVVGAQQFDRERDAERRQHQRCCRRSRRASHAETGAAALAIVHPTFPSLRSCADPCPVRIAPAFNGSSENQPKRPGA